MSLVLRQYDLACLSLFSYLVGDTGSGRAVVVDPQRDVTEYLADAAAEGLTIERVLETHFHADFLSGHLELAAATGAAISYGSAARTDFPMEPLEHGQVLSLGQVTLEVRHTPGHTPESIALVVSDLRRGPEPWFVCTGDTLFVGSVGRPDLPGRERDNAAELHHSLHEKLLALPEGLEVYPAHFSGSPCGAGLSGKPMSTLAFEKQWNTLLGLERDAFVDQVGTSAPPKPADMDAIVRFNQGRG